MANILGINTGDKNLTEILAAISAFYNDKQPHLLVTPNPEIILSAQTDEELFFILNQADLSLADGFGLKIGAAISGQTLNRITGADITPLLLKEADSNKRRLLIINRFDGLSSQADIENYIIKNYPNIELLVKESAQQASPDQNDIAQISDFNPDLTLCLLGSPFQEKYLFHLQEKIPTISLGAGIGGTFDFLVGKVKRAPAWWRKAGFEWLWRLIQQPSRYRRIWRATVVFSIKLLNWRFIMSRRYRPNVAVLMYKTSSKGSEFFIVERRGQEGHWQIPQGGLDGLDLVSAGTKEIQEEAGIINYKIVASYKNLFRYDFNKENGKYSNSEKQRHFGFKGQRQSLLIIKFTGSDTEIKINYWDHSAWRWELESNFLSALHPCRQEAGKIYLNKFKSLHK